MPSILKWVKAGIAVVASAALALAVWGLRTIARWIGITLLTHVFPRHVTGWLAETVYWIIGTAAALGLTAFILDQFDLSAPRLGLTAFILNQFALFLSRLTLRVEPLGRMLFKNLRQARALDEAEASLDGDLPGGDSLEELLAPGTAEYVNFNIFDTTESVEYRLHQDEGLYNGLDYKLVVGMGMIPDVRFAGGEQKKVERPAGAKVVLDVVLALAENLEIPKESWATLEWPESGPSLKNAEFPLRSLAPGPARVKVLMYFEHDLLFCGDLEFDVHSEGDEWSLGQRPIRWKTLDPDTAGGLSLFRKFRDLDRESRRRINISVHRRTAGLYDLVFFLRSGQPTPRAYPLRVEISDRDISAFLARTRSALRLLTASHDASDSDEYSSEKFLDDMSLVGSELWNKLFGSEMGQRLAGILKQDLDEDGAIVQVWSESAASDFVLPWVWIYPHPVVAGKRQQTDCKQFWGYRYVIEQLRQLPGEKRPASVVTEEPLRIAAALHNFKAAAAERDFFTEWSTKYSARLSWAEVKPADWRRFLPKCDAHMVYFYCHGHTAQPLSTVDTEILRTLQRLAAASPAETAAWVESLTSEQRKRVRGQSVIAIEKEILNMTDLGRFKPADPNLRPVVFLNMCESAEFYPGATDNLVDIFLKRGARGVIGTEVSVLAAFGDSFARGFFESFFAAGRSGDGQEIGAVLWQLRRGFLDQGNPLGFVYTYFGDATTRLKPAIIDLKSQVVDGGHVHDG